MARKCDLTGKGVLSGNRVSHSKRHTRHKFLPNVHKRRIWSTEQQKFFVLKVSAAALRTLDKVGLDSFARSAGLKL